MKFLIRDAKITQILQIQNKLTKNIIFILFHTNRAKVFKHGHYQIPKSLLIENKFNFHIL